MRLYNYTEEVLNEKVTKREKQEALKNKNILIGCEFEFKFDEPLGGNGEIEELYRKAYDEWEEYNKEVRDYIDAREEYAEETESMKEESEELQKKIDELADAISDGEIAVEEWTDRISEIEDEISDDSWEPPAKAVYDKVIKTPEEEISIIKKKISDIEDDIDEWDQEASQYQKKFDSLDDDIQYRENEGIYEEINPPYLSKNAYPYYFEYMGDWMGMDETALYTEPGEESSNQPYDVSNEYSNGDEFKDVIESSGILDSAPFDDYEVGDYEDVEQNVGSTTWAVEKDDTVTGDNIEGVEVANPPMELPKFVPKILIDMFDWIDEIGYTDNDCGFHVHMSLKNSKGIDPLKLILFTEEDYIYKVFESRRNNNYVNSIKDKVKKQGRLDKIDIDRLFNYNLLNVKMLSTHYDSVNIVDLEDGHVEFRYMGGSMYHRKEKEIIDIISTYSYWLSLAADPEFKKKEYIHKIIRILNKTEMFEYLAILAALDKVLSSDEVDEKDKIRFRVLYKEYKKKYDGLKKYYKLDKKTVNLITDNAGFMFDVKTKIDEIINPFDLSVYQLNSVVRRFFSKGGKII